MITYSQRKALGANRLMHLSYWLSNKICLAKLCYQSKRKKLFSLTSTTFCSFIRFLFQCFCFCVFFFFFVVVVVKLDCILDFVKVFSLHSVNIHFGFECYHFAKAGFFFSRFIFSWFFFHHARHIIAGLEFYFFS